MIDDLIKIFGRENASVDRKDLLAYSFDASDVEGTPTAVVWPRNTAQVSELMKYCSRNNVRVFPRGAGTNLSGGAVPLDGIVADFSRMNRIVDYTGDAVTVEPGVVLEDLEYYLNERKKTLPVNPASDKACTVGGCIAEDSAGIRAVKYGTMGDWVLELEVVTPDGSITAGGKDFIGSEGILGLITKARLRVIDMPKVRTLTVLQLESLSEVQEKAMFYSKQGVSSLEFVGRLANSLIKKPLGTGNILVVEFEDDRGIVKDQKEVETITEDRKNVSSQLASNGFIHVEDPKVPLERAAEFLSELESMGVPAYGHLGYGIIHPRFRDAKTRADIAGLVGRLGANPVGEHGIGLLKKAAGSKRHLAGLKLKYDPEGILNPGKVLPGGDVPEVTNVEVCVLCGMCRSRCPVFKALLTESVSPRGLAVFMEKKLVDTVFWEKCSQCRACDGVCPMKADLSRKIREYRSMLIKKGVETEANCVMMDNVRKYGNPFGRVNRDETPKELYCC
jgi:glycolate oxidase